MSSDHHRCRFRSVTTFALIFLNGIPKRQQSPAWVYKKTIGGSSTNEYSRNSWLTRKPRHTLHSAGRFRTAFMQHFISMESWNLSTYLAHCSPSVVDREVGLSHVSYSWLLSRVLHIHVEIALWDVRQQLLCSESPLHCHHSHNSNAYSFPESLCESFIRDAEGWISPLLLYYQRTNFEEICR